MFILLFIIFLLLIYLNNSVIFYLFIFFNSNFIFDYGEFTVKVLEIKK
jgi:hypothetical protein